LDFHTRLYIAQLRLTSWLIHENTLESSRTLLLH
jgi:hypothetical protein